MYVFFRSTEELRMKKGTQNLLTFYYKNKGLKYVVHYVSTKYW